MPSNTTEYAKNYYESKKDVLKINASKDYYCTFCLCVVRHCGQAKHKYTAKHIKNVNKMSLTDPIIPTPTVDIL